MGESLSPRRTSRHEQTETANRSRGRDAKPRDSAGSQPGYRSLQPCPEWGGLSCRSMSRRSRLAFLAVPSFRCSDSAGRARRCRRLCCSVCLAPRGRPPWKGPTAPVKHGSPELSWLRTPAVNARRRVASISRPPKTERRIVCRWLAGYSIRYHEGAAEGTRTFSRPMGQHA